MIPESETSGGCSSPRGRGGPHRTTPTLRLLLLALAAVACTPGPEDPQGLEQLPPASLVRGPYLQDVSDTAASVRWRTSEGASGEVVYRVGDGPWRGHEAEDLGGGDRRVRLTGLPPDASVTYRVEAGTARVDEATFRTPPGAGAGDSVVVLAFGDSGYGSSAQVELARLMEDRPWDLALHVGDIAYNDGTEEELTGRHFEVYWELLRRVPFYPAVGNHDIRTRDGEPYDRAFEWPAASQGARYYAFRWGQVLFLSLDTASRDALRSLRTGRGAQYRWLRDRLVEASGDPGVRWTVVFMHRPVYSSASGPAGHGGDEELREVLAPLFERGGVDLVLQGHDHNYERTHPVRGGVAASPGCGPVYLVTGGGGGSRVGRYVDPSDLTVDASRAHHFLRLVLGPETIRGTAIGREGARVDRFRIRPYDPESGSEEARCRDSVGGLEFRPSEEGGMVSAPRRLAGPDRTARSNVRVRAASGLRRMAPARSLQATTPVGGASL